jgi:tRNA1Val (adenine37-N6)-methyltransferase
MEGKGIPAVRGEGAGLKMSSREDSFLIREGETIDALPGGRLKVIQKEKGYRFSVDAYLLAHFVQLKQNDRVLDMGTGSGVISIIVAVNSPYARVVGLDVQEEMVEMARRSIAMNGLDDRIDVRQGDVRKIVF